MRLTTDFKVGDVIEFYGLNGSPDKHTQRLEVMGVSISGKLQVKIIHLQLVTSIPLTDAIYMIQTGIMKIVEEGNTSGT